MRFKKSSLRPERWPSSSALVLGLNKGSGAEQELGIYPPYANPTQPPTEPLAVWVKNLLKFQLAASHDVLPFVRLTPLTAVGLPLHRHTTSLTGTTSRHWWQYLFPYSLSLQSKVLHSGHLGTSSCFSLFSFFNGNLSSHRLFLRKRLACGHEGKNSPPSSACFSASFL